jgi:hypothetical protein
MISFVSDDGFDIAQTTALSGHPSAKGVDYIEVVLPASLLTNDSAPVEVRWAERASPSVPSQG